MSRTTYANVVATLALLMAASAGGAYAASQLPKDSVRSKQVKDHSLTAQDFKVGQLAAGAPGVAGPAGPAGPRGPQGEKGTAGPAGPSVVTSGYVTKSPDPFATACIDATVAGEEFTVPAPTVLWVSGSAHYVPQLDAAEMQHKGYANVALMTGSSRLAETGLGTTTWTGPGELAVTGTLHGPNGHAFVLKPLTTYKLVTELFTRTNCPGAANVSNVRLDWLGFAAP
jgi:hypothetical protein